MTEFLCSCVYTKFCNIHVGNVVGNVYECPLSCYFSCLCAFVLQSTL